MAILTDAWLDAYFTSAPAALGLLDRNLRLVKTNDRGAQMLGVPLDQLLGRSVRDIAPALAVAVEPLLAQLLTSGEPVFNREISGELPAQPGVIRQWVVSLFPVPAGALRPQGVGVIAVEESARREAEAAARRAGAELHAFVEQATHGIYYSTLDGRFLRVNSALVQMLGYESEAEVLQLSLPNDVYVDPGQRERLIVEHRRANVIKGLEVEWHRRDGQPIFVRLSGRPLRDDHDLLTGFAMIAEDITEQRRMSRALAQAQKMEAIGQLTSGIAHDFNNLLTVILAHASFVQQALPDTDPEVCNDLTTVQTAARQGGDLVRKVLALGRHEKLEPRRLDLGPTAKDVLATLRRMLPSNIQLQVSVADSVWVQADPGAVQQILLNLATNARDAMPEGGTLHVSVRREHLTEDDRPLHEWIVPGWYGCLLVSDTGTGMDAQTLAHVFDPFFTTKPAGVGTGLGLAMVYGLVKQQQGFVLLHSEPGLGTTAKIYLPRAAEETPTSGPLLAEERPAGGCERILLLEDEPALRRVAHRVLAKAGYAVRSAPDAQEGWAIYEANPLGVDLIVTDYMMPNLDGLQLHDRLRQRGAALKMVFSSGYAEPRLREQLQSDPRVAFVTKPWTTAELLRTVRALLDDRLAEDRQAEIL